MLPPFKTLHYKKNWFTALFAVFTKTITQTDGGEPFLWFKMNWSNGYKVFAEPACQNPLLELRWQRKVGIWAWDVFVGEKQIGNVASDVIKTALALGVEKWNIVDANGKPVLLLASEKNAALKQFADDMMRLYNPTHSYTLTAPGGEPVASITMRHGIFGGTYDLVFQKGTEEQRQMATALFVAILMMMKR